ncbi:MAG: RnfABCDGE type electron transport complex subunit D [Chloroflexota bacterium]|nr:RnfABCDGE type electron transport complex subunit D [Chloroflexota bacterium]
MLLIFIGLTALASLNVGADVVATKVTVAATTAAAIDVPLTYVRRRTWILPDGAVLTGMIVAFVLRPEEPWLVLVGTVAAAILIKHALRTHWSNILNPAAFALVVSAIFLNAGQSWWGALPDLGIIGAVLVLAAGAFIAERLNKLPMILAFFGAYFTMFTIASFFRSSAVAETFVTPDLQAALFFAFFMLDDPPTSPVRHEDQVVFGITVAAIAYFIYMRFGGVYYLPAGLLAGNLWESGRRLVFSRMRTREATTARVQGSRRLASGVGLAVLAVPLMFASGIYATGGTSADSSPVSAVIAPSPTAGAAPGSVPSVAPGTPGTPNPYPFEPTFDSDFTGTYTQAQDATSAHLVLDGLAKGDFSLGVHVELLQLSVVPTPDAESIETAPDDEAVEARPQVTTTINKAQLLDPASKGLLCDGKLTALAGGTMRFGCDGAAAYLGIHMQIAGQPNAAADGTFSGTLSGTMQRTS